MEDPDELRTILFDWDGTLVDSIGSLYEAQAVVSGRLGLPFDEAMYRQAFSPNWRRMYPLLGIPDERVEEAAQIWVESFDAKAIPLFPGVREALARLAGAGYALGLVTGGYGDLVTAQIERLGLAELLPVRVFGDELESGKPDPALLRLALERVAADPAQAAYVGDALDDMRMAVAADVHGVGIVSFIATADELLAAGAGETAASAVDWIDRLLARRAAR